MCWGMCTQVQLASPESVEHLVLGLVLGQQLVLEQQLAFCSPQHTSSCCVVPPSIVEHLCYSFYYKL